MKIMLKHRVLAFAMAMVMLCSLLPVSVFAEDGEHVHCVCTQLCGETPNAACSVCAADGTACSPTAPADPVAPVAEDGETGGGESTGGGNVGCTCTTQCTATAYDANCAVCSGENGYTNNCEICDHDKHGYSDCGQCMVIAINNSYGKGEVQTAQHMKSCYDNLSDTEKAYVTADYVEKLNQMVAGTDVSTGGGTTDPNSCTHSFTYTANGASIVQTCGTCGTSLTKTIKGYNDYKGILQWDGYHQEVEGYTQTVTYYKGETPLTAAPTDAGSYQVKVAIGGATAVYSFEIAHKHTYKYVVDEATPHIVTRDYTCEGCGDATMTLVYYGDGTSGAVGFEPGNEAVWGQGLEERADYPLTIKNASGEDVSNGDFADGTYTATATYTDKAIGVTVNWTLTFTVGESSGGETEEHTHDFKYGYGSFDDAGTYKNFTETCTVEGC